MKAKWLVIIVFASLLFCFPARADMGPKPEINITVKNPPDEEYYLDLLIEGDADGNYYPNIKNGSAVYNDELLDLLRKNRETGWHLGITDGTGTPMSGKLTGVQDDSKMVHHFGYIGVPDQFKIIVVTKNGNVQISEVYNRHSFTSNLVYDYRKNSVRDRAPIVLAYLFQFVTTCIPTLIVEGILLLAFGFSSKQNWKKFLYVNLITQILLTATMGQALIKGGLLMAMIVQFIIELLILIGESTAYAFLLEGHGRGRRIGYGITANLCTWAMGAFIIVFQSLTINVLS